MESYNQQGMAGAMTAIEQAAGFKSAYDESWILPNVRKVCDLALRHGNTHIRAFADVDSKARLEGVKALLKAREEYRGRVTLEVVAFPQDGIVREPGAAELVVEAAELGVDVIGGIPWIEYTKADEQSCIDQMFEIALRYDKDISMLLDDVGDPEERTLKMLCLATLKHGWQGRVTAQHCRAMSLYNENYFRRQRGMGLLSHFLWENGTVAPPLSVPARLLSQIRSCTIEAGDTCESYRHNFRCHHNRFCDYNFDIRRKNSALRSACEYPKEQKMGYNYSYREKDALVFLNHDYLHLCVAVFY